MAEHVHITPERTPTTAPRAAGRRSLFSAVTALACMPVLGVSAVPVSPDAELVRLARAHEALGRQSNADFPEVDSDDHPLAVAAEARRNLITEQQGELMDGMLEHPPTTLEGLQALAGALAVWDLNVTNPRHAQDDGMHMIAALVRGLLDMRGAA